ncbi:MAG: response regulator transcription factor [Firmicutes bacterium]|nr:response regulator transcription factor [Bacillota bacterium]
MGVSPRRAVRVAIVEDEPLYRDLLEVALEQDPELEVVAACGDAAEALERLPPLKPDVALLDLDLGEGPDGVQLGRELRRRLAGLGIILLSHHRDPRWLEGVPPGELAGWSYLLKRSLADASALRRAVRGAAEGLVVLDPALVAGFTPRRPSRLESLTPRQREILALMAQGFHNGAIARRLRLTAKSVENQIHALYQALGIKEEADWAHPRVQAVLIYLQESRYAT